MYGFLCALSHVAIFDSRTTQKCVPTGVPMKLNLDLLRWKSKLRDITAGEALRFSRRHFMQGATTAALGYHLAPLRGEDITFHHDAGQASFSVDGQKRWIYMPGTFEGDTRLRVQRHTTSEVKFSITGGFYFGTAVPMDIEVDARLGLRGWNYSIHLPQQGFRSQGELLQWLNGSPATWRNPRPTRCFAEESPIQIRSEAGNLIGLRCDWGISCIGKTSISLPQLRDPLLANGVHLTPFIGRGDAEALLTHSGPFSRLSLGRGGHTWGSEFVDLLRVPVVQVQPDNEIFDQIFVDAFGVEAGFQPQVGVSFSQSTVSARATPWLTGLCSRG